jgi:hypothetical protein
MNRPHTRRTFLRRGAGTLAVGLPLAAAGGWPFESALKSFADEPPSRRKKLPVAAVITEYRNNSHADVIIGKILEGFDQLGGAGPALKVAAMYTDQVPENDMSRDLAKRYGFPIVQTIDEAITLGTDKLAVAGVLLIGEHGDYPHTPDTHQHMYPRRRFFDQTVAAFRRCGQTAPVFNDKHLGYAYADAKAMYDTARKMGFPLMAGSSLPLVWRVPDVTLSRGCRIEEAMALGYGGLEAYGFHALETLQCMVERRAGGEVGVQSVQALKGDAIWEAQRQGRFSRDLLDAALKSLPRVTKGPIEDNLNDQAAFYLLQYRDGLRATVAMINGHAAEFGFAAQLKDQDQPVATNFQTQEGKPFMHFGELVKAIEHLVHTHTVPYPLERTLLTTGVLDAAMHSLANEGREEKTPQLKISYKAVDWPHLKGTVPPNRGL